MAEEVSCPYCGHPNAADAMFCEACSRVLEVPDALDSQIRKTYLDLEKALITETSAFLCGRTCLIAGFVGFVILGLGFTILKYAVYLDQDLSC